FMSRKLLKDLRRKKTIYDLAEDVQSRELREYYFVMDEQKLRAGVSQNFHFDEQGIPMIPTYIDVEERKLVYYPISIGQFGLAIFHTCLRTESEEDKQRFLKIADWFIANKESSERLGDYWLTHVPKPEFRMMDPWPSAFAQSRGISILLRAWQLTGKSDYLQTAEKALTIFSVAAGEKGVTTFTDVGPLYEEYPTHFLTGVLDGSIFALFGLYDYVRAVDENSEAERLFSEGCDALKKLLPRYDLGYWLRYNLCTESFYPKLDPATIMYFRMIGTQLDLLSRMSGDPAFAEFAEKWRKYDKRRNILRMYFHKFQALRKLNRL
ncbi:MAG: D-glucuronyl C5-epimerase family protein, partial [Calditrichota bacterium]